MTAKTVAVGSVLVRLNCFPPTLCGENEECGSICGSIKFV